jgi:hypothetical protein
VANSPQIMRLDVGEPEEEPCLKRIPPGCPHLIETVGPVEYPRPATPSIDMLDFPCKCPIGHCICTYDD